MGRTIESPCTFPGAPRPSQRSHSWSRAVRTRGPAPTIWARPIEASHIAQLKTLEQRPVGEDTREHLQAARERDIRRDTTKRVARAAKRVFDAEHRHATAQRAIVAGAHQAFVVREAGAAQIGEQAHPIGIANLLIARPRPLPQLDRQHRRADRLAVRKIARDIEGQRQTAEKLREPGERHGPANVPRRVCCDRERRPKSTASEIRRLAYCEFEGAAPRWVRRAT